jgi:hypothetical protein
MKFRCKYTYEDDGFAKRHVWICIGVAGALHLHISEIKQRPGEPEDWKYSGGIEVHYRAPPDYMSEDAPSHDRCWLLKAPCWHDGSSLQATEAWIPLWRASPNDHDHMFALLRGEMGRRFAEMRDGTPEA